MNELSIFIDESGDLGPYDYHSPYYIITMVFHDQSKDISSPIAKLNEDLLNRGYKKNHCVHTGPIIRRENDYEFVSITFTLKGSTYRVSFMLSHKQLWEVKSIKDGVYEMKISNQVMSLFIDEADLFYWFDVNNVTRGRYTDKKY